MAIRPPTVPPESVVAVRGELGSPFPDSLSDGARPIRPSQAWSSVLMALGVLAAMMIVVLASGRLNQTTTIAPATPDMAEPAASTAVVLAEPVDLQASFVSAVNALRSSAGLTLLAPDAQLAAAAESWAMVMSAEADLRHSDNPREGAPEGWTTVSEIVGTGASIDEIMAAFESSGEHRQNLLDPGHSVIGVGAVRDVDGTVWTVHRFATVTASPASD